MGRKKLDREISAVYEGKKEATKESHKFIEKKQRKRTRRSDAVDKGKDNRK